MSSTLSDSEFLLRATAFIKAGQSPPKGTETVKLLEPEAPVIKDLGNGLLVTYVVDRDDGLVFIQNHHLTGTNLTEGGLHELALHNLAERTSGSARMNQHGTVYEVFVDELFEASLVLLDHLWDETLAHLAPNGFVVAIPARDVLVFCDAKSEEGIRGLRIMAEKVFEQGGHLLTKNLYRRQDRKWVVMN